MSKKVRKKVHKILKKQLTGVSLFFAVLFLIIGIVIGFYLYNINNKEGFSKIELNGNGIVNLKVGDNYNEEGFTMVIDDYDYADKVLVNGSVDTSKEGTYELVDAHDGVAIIEGTKYKIQLAAVGLAITVDGVDGFSFGILILIL